MSIVTWVLLSAAFGFYVANFSSYDTIYGTLGGVIVFLLWLWLTDLALLFGASIGTEPSTSRNQMVRSADAAPARPRTLTRWGSATSLVQSGRSASSPWRQP